LTDPLTLIELHVDLQPQLNPVLMEGRIDATA